MQAIILAAGRGYGLNQLTKNNAKCMVSINNETLIERILKQVDKLNLNKIVIVEGYQKSALEDHIKGIEINTPLYYVENPIYSETNNIYSLSLAKEFMTEDDSLIIEADIIFEDKILFELVENKNSAVAVIDKYKSWMTGKSVSLNKNNEIVGFVKENEVDHNGLKNCYKTIGMYKFDASFFNQVYLPFMEAYIKVYGNNPYYEQVLDVLSSISQSKISTQLVDKSSWYEINTIQDIDLASTLFSKDEEAIVKSMLGRWGGYWRYPDYLDYFYLVTPYYPTSELIEELKANFEDLLLQYPSGMRVNALLAAKEFFVEAENIVIGNGAAEVIKSLMTRVSGATGFLSPTFDEYLNRYCNGEIVRFTINSRDFKYSAEDIINYFSDKEIRNLVIVNPDNPSGNYIEKKDMYKLFDWTKERDIKLIIDESFVDFADEENPTIIQQDIIDKYRNLYIIKSISKSYGVPGLRLGVLVSGDIDTIAWMKKDVAIWNINSIAEFYMQIAGKYRKDYNKALEMFREERASFLKELSSVDGIEAFPSQANYILVELSDNIDAEMLKRKMLVDEKIFLKSLDGKIQNGKHYLRIAIRDHEDNKVFIDALRRMIKKCIKGTIEER